MITDAEIDSRLARLGERVRSRGEATRTRLAEIGALDLAQALRTAFDARLVYLGPYGQRPAWLDWPHHTAAVMARESWRAAVKNLSNRQGRA